MNSQFARRIGTAFAAIAIAASTLLAPLTTIDASAAAIPAAQTSHLDGDGRISLGSDLAVLPQSVVKVNGKFYYVFHIKNLGVQPVESISVNREVMVKYWDGTFKQDVRTTTSLTKTIKKGEHVVQMVECPANGYTTYCEYASIGVKVTKGWTDINSGNDIGYLHQSTKNLN